MSDRILENVGKAKEEEYFARKNAEATNRLAEKLRQDAMLSPVSGEAMVATAVGPAVVYRCVQSGGMWIESNELSSVFKSEELEEQNALTAEFFHQAAELSRKSKAHGELKIALESEAIRKSPVADAEMEKIDVDGIILDRCPVSGGIWFDAGEFEELQKREVSGEYSRDSLNSWVTLFLKGIGYK